LIPTIERAGGRVLVRALVQDVLIDRAGKAVGVTVKGTSGGDDDVEGGGSVAIHAKHGVICGAGAVALQKLVPSQWVDRLGYTAMLEAVKPSISHVYGFIGMSATSEELGLRGANLWVIPINEEADAEDEEARYEFHGPAIRDSDKGDTAAWADRGNRDEVDDLPLFMGFPSMKDPSFEARFPGKATCEIITTAHTEWFDQYLDPEGKNESGKRSSQAYKELKEQLKEKLLRSLYRHYPLCKGRVEYAEVATPLTNLHYLGKPDSYGLEHTPGHYSGKLDMMRPQTNIDQLWLTGQDCGSCGIVGALNGGILTAHAVLGYGFWDLVVAKRNLIEDLMAMDEAQKKGDSTEPKSILDSDTLLVILFALFAAVAHHVYSRAHEFAA